MLKEASAKLGQEIDDEVAASRNKQGVCSFAGEGVLNAAPVVGGEPGRRSRQGGLGL